MTQLHRAYAFHHAAFRAELAPVLEAALSAGDAAPLAGFIERHLDALSDPYEGEPLSKDWRKLLESGDVQELGDFALTKYYDGDLDMGLDADWLEVKDDLTQAGASAELLLGAPFGPSSQPFDPSRQGSYFQSEADVVRAHETAALLATQNAKLAETLAPLLGLLSQAARHGKGLYVTF